MEDAVPPPGRVTLAGFSDTVGPLGETLPVRSTVPENPLKLVIVMVEAPEDPTGTTNPEGLAAMPKSAPTTAKTVAVCKIEPIVALT